MDSSTGRVPVPTGPMSIIQRLRGEFYRFLDSVQQPGLRRAFPAILIVLAAATAFAGYLLLMPADRLTVQSGLSEADRARALEMLSEQGFDARIDPSTGDLTVNASEFGLARLALAAEGLPQGAPDGMSVISDIPMGTSRSIEAARLRRMLELDLSQTISELHPVEAARVHLALPERTAFVRDTQPPSASVVIQLRTGMDLNENQIRAITGLVSGAVPSMEHANVSIVDQTGRLLSNDDTDTASGFANTQLRHRLQLEQIYRERVLSLITPMVGTGNAAVQVTIDMDFSQSEVVDERFLPEQTALRSEQESHQESGSISTGGIPGALSNTPAPDPSLTDGAAPNETTAAENRDIHSSATRNYEVSRRVETILPQTGVVTRISAAILLRTGMQDEDGIASSTGESLLENIEALTRSAIGFEEARGDIVTVSSAPFVEPAPVFVAPWYQASWLPMLGRAMAQLAILAIVIIGVVRPLLTRILPRGGPNDHSLLGVGDAVEVRQGETLESLRTRLENAAPTADELNGAISYEEKIELLREIGQAEGRRIATVFEGMIATDQSNGR